MSEQGPIFSESWHRVAPQRLALRAAVQIRKQIFRGEEWYVLQDSFDNQFHRFTPAAYQFLSRLRADRTVQEVWEECLEASPEQAPTQPELIRLLTQLYQANLLQTQMPPDAAKLLERHDKREQRKTFSTLLNFLFIKVPLCDPDAFLKRCVPLLGWLLTPWAALGWLMAIVAGLKIAGENWSELSSAGESVFAPDNFLLLYAAFIVTKAIHEFGHAFLCRALGGEVHRIGVMFMIFSPMPFVDATSSWAFRSRWHRILVASGGMIFELAFAALAAWVWSTTGPGTLHRFAYNSMVVASVSTLLFNLNPLLRFDGYYILSDLLELPNLASRSLQEVRYAWERWICGAHRPTTVAHSQRERAWLIVYGVSSAIYRVVLSLAIVLYIGDRFFELGLLLAIFFLFSTTVLPVTKFVRYLAASPSLARCRPRAWVSAGGLTALIVGFLGLAPMPERFRAPGVVEAENFSGVYAAADGFVEKVLARSSGEVVQSAPLVRLRNPELEINLAQAEAKKRELFALREEALNLSPSALGPLQTQIAALEGRLTNLRKDEVALTVRAPQNGVWVAPHHEEWQGGWVERGAALGELINPGAFRFSAVVSQAEAAALFSHGIRGTEVRLNGEAGEVIHATIERIVPGQQHELPSAALGWRSGGDLAVQSNDPSGLRSTEPFFQVVASLQPAPGVLLAHHRSGEIRFELPSQPLLAQWWRRLRQLVQQRYRI